MKNLSKPIKIALIVAAGIVGFLVVLFIFKTDWSFSADNSSSIVTGSSLQKNSPTDRVKNISAEERWKLANETASQFTDLYLDNGIYEKEKKLKRLLAARSLCSEEVGKKELDPEIEFTKSKTGNGDSTNHPITYSNRQIYMKSQNIEAENINVCVMMMRKEQQGQDVPSKYLLEFTLSWQAKTSSWLCSKVIREDYFFYSGDRIGATDYVTDAQEPSD